MYNSKVLIFLQYFVFMKKIAYTHGRFQPFHNGHFALMLKILEKYDTLWIGISNPLRIIPSQIYDLPEKTREEILRARSNEQNPYSFIERLIMIRAAFAFEGIDLSRIIISPHFAFYDGVNPQDYMPSPEDTVIALSPKDLYHFAKIEKYKQQGYDVEIFEQIGNISGKNFDKEWPNGDWESVVPKGTAKIMLKIKK